MLHPGLYEQVINNALTSELAEIPEARKSVAPIDRAEASKVLAQYLADVVQKGLDNVLDNGGDISAQIGLTNQIVDLIQNTTKEAGFAALGVDQRAEQLLALLREADPRLAVGKTAAETSIAQSSLFTIAEIEEPATLAEKEKRTILQQEAPKEEQPEPKTGPIETPVASELQLSTGQAPAKNSAPEPTPPQPSKELHPGDKVYVAGFGWVEYKGPNHSKDGTDIYENGNKIGIIG
jgi:hypothetical protein